VLIILFPPTIYFFAKGNKKDLYPRHGCLDKGLAGDSIVPDPSLTTVLTDTGSAISPADSYSPLLFE
jgi:hypothetical protein